MAGTGFWADYGFWLVAGVLGFAVAGALLRGMARARAGGPEDSPAAKARALYRSQLEEIERDLAKGTIAPIEAERMRIEVQRRILDTARIQETDAGTAGRGAQGLALATVMAAVLGAWGAYFALGAPDYPDLPLSKRLALAEANYNNRPAQAEAEAAAPAIPAQPVDPEFAALIEKLRAAVAQRPDDVQGLTLLARNEAQLGNYAAAARAYGALIAAKGEAAGAEDHLGAAQAMIAAAGGIVTPEAEAALAQTLALDPGNGLARYFSGLMFAQVGRPDRSFALWEPLLRESPEDAPWVEPIRALLPEIADAAGINYSLPEDRAAAARALAGPDAADIANAAQMSEDERRVMINTMVTGLEARLLEQGGTPEEWVRLISSLGILGETGRARLVLTAGTAALQGDAAALAALQEAATNAGIAP